MNGKRLLLGAFVFLFASLPAEQKNPKILHLSFHKGCVKDFEEVAVELGLDVTSWYILGERKTEFDGEGRGNEVYNITHARAKKVWDLNKDYFDQFDVILTSDTAPLSRIFVQNGWKKPLIIWICNRFDYFHSGGADNEYYDLFRKAATMPNVRVISYTPYEKYYAAKKNVHVGDLLIKPLGAVKTGLWEGFKSSIPQDVVKEETLFIPPRYDDRQLQYIQGECSSHGIKTYSGIYNGPCDLAGFKGVIFFPYQWSNLMLFEYMSLGLVQFIPSKKFINELFQQRTPIRYFTRNLNEFEIGECYHPDNKDIFVYFDSWQDLQNKLNTINFEAKKSKILEVAKNHQLRMLQRWETIINSLIV